MPRDRQPVPFGPPMQSLDAAQRREGMSGEFYNVFRDRDGGLRRRPGLQIFKDFNEAGRPILGLWESLYPLAGLDKNFYSLRKGASSPVLEHLTSTGVATVQTGHSLGNVNLPTWTNDAGASSGHEYVANGTSIQQIRKATNTVVPLSTPPYPNSPAGVTHIGYAKTYLVANGLISGGIEGDVNFSNDPANNYVGTNSWRFFNNEQRPDGTGGLVIDHDEIAAWGSRSMEVSYATPSPPWSAADGAFLPYGVLANYSVQWLNGELFFLSTVDRQPHFIRVSERQPQVLSSPYDVFLSGLTAAQLAGCQGHTVAFAGMVFYIAQFPGVATLVYNPQWKEWYRWSSFASGIHNPWVVNCAEYVESFNKMLIGDRIDSKIWEVLPSLRSDTGTGIQVQLNTGQIRRGTGNKKRSVLYQAVFKRGSVNDSSTPQVGVRFNDDGEGFGAQRFMSLGSAGQKYMTFLLQGCGMYRHREIELTHNSTASEFILISMEEEFDILSS